MLNRIKNLFSLLYSYRNIIIKGIEKTIWHGRNQIIQKEPQIRELPPGHAGKKYEGTPIFKKLLTQFDYLEESELLNISKPIMKSKE